VNDLSFQTWTRSRTLIDIYKRQKQLDEILHDTQSDGDDFMVVLNDHLAR